jgi:hypothetical protein
MPPRVLPLFDLRSFYQVVNIQTLHTMNGDPNPVNGDAPPGQGVLPPSEGALPPVSANQFTIRVSVENAEIRRILREGIYHLKVADYFQSGESEEELRYRENVITIDSNEPTSK